MSKTNNPASCSLDRVGGVGLGIKLVLVRVRASFLLSMAASNQRFPAIDMTDGHHHRKHTSGSDADRSSAVLQ
jgi:hypothetical protein